MPDIKVEHYFNMDLSDPCCSPRMTKATIYDGPNAYPMNVTTPRPDDYVDEYRRHLADIIAEAFRLGKEAR